LNENLKQGNNVIQLDSSFSMRSTQFPEIGTPDIRRKIAEELKPAREFHEISLEEVRAITKINISYLESLENGIWGFLPSVYIKLFIRAFAEAVGIQSEEFSNHLDEVFGSIHDDLLLGEPIDNIDPGFDTLSRSKASPFFHWAERNKALILYGSIIAVALIVIIAYLAKPPENSISYQPEEPPQENVAIDNVQVNPLASLDAIPVLLAAMDSIKTELPPTFKFTLTTAGTCYVKIVHADTLLYERTLWPGNRLQRDYPDPIVLTVGNAPEVKLFANDKPLPAFTSRKKVRVLRIGANGIVH